MKTLDYALWGIAGLAVGAVALRLSEPGADALLVELGPEDGHQFPPPKSRGALFASGPMDPVWPIQSSDNPRHGQVAYLDVHGTKHGNMSRAFRARRGSGARNHAGIDIYADGGDVVVAPESGQIVSEQNFLNSIPGKDAVMLQTDSGLVLLFGEVVARSYKEFGLAMGSRVAKGQPLARVATTSKGSHMLHFETYEDGTRKNKRWLRGAEQPPSALRDPTAYLLRAKQRMT